MYQEIFGCNDLYVADLDAIARKPGAGFGASGSERLPSGEWLLGLRAAVPDVCLWVDAGVGCLEDVGRLVDAGVDQVILALETLPGPELLDAEGLRRYGALPGNVAVSLDLDAGVPRTAAGACWADPADPLSLVEQLVDNGITQLLILDLRKIGANQGIGTLPLIQTIRLRYPRLVLHAGGGVRGYRDVEMLHEEGVSGILVASALLDGRITRSDLDNPQAPSPR